MTESQYGVLLLQEAPLHPASKLIEIKGAFEAPSVISVDRKDILRFYTKPPVFDRKYLVIFEDLRLFESNRAFLKLDIMFPVVLCSTGGMLEDAKDICKDKEIPYSVFVNEFTKNDAYAMIRSLASTEVTQEFCKALVSRVGLSPHRLLGAIMVLEQVGYKTSNVTKYIDKYVYIDSWDVIAALLHICKSKAQRLRADTYLHMNRLWYIPYTRDRLVAEVDTVIRIYQDAMNGTLTSYSLHSYMEESRLSRRKILRALDLLEVKSLGELLTVRTFLSTASLLEVSLKILN